MRIKMIFFFLVLVIGGLLIYSAPWAQQKYTASPKQVQSSQPIQQAGPKVTFGKSSSVVSKPVATVSPQNLPRALTPEQRRQAIREARLAAGINQANLPPDPPVTIHFTPLSPMQGNSCVETICMSCFPLLNVPFWKISYGDRCSDPKKWPPRFILKLQTMSGKRYLLDVSVTCSRKNTHFWFKGDLEASAREIDDHVLLAFAAKDSQTRIELWPAGETCYASQFELTRID